MGEHTSWASLSPRGTRRADPGGGGLAPEADRTQLARSTHKLGMVSQRRPGVSKRSIVLVVLVAPGSGARVGPLLHRCAVVPRGRVLLRAVDEHPNAGPGRRRRRGRGGAILWLNLWIASRVEPAYRISVANRRSPLDELERYREVVSRTSGGSGSASRLFVGLLAGAGAAASWEKVLLWMHKRRLRSRRSAVRSRHRLLHVRAAVPEPGSRLVVVRDDRSDRPLDRRAVLQRLDPTGRWATRCAVRRARAHLGAPRPSCGGQGRSVLAGPVLAQLLRAWSRDRRELHGCECAAPGPQDARDHLDPVCGSVHREHPGPQRDPSPGRGRHLDPVRFPRRRGVAGGGSVLLGRPQEVQREAPYIERNIQETQVAFGLDDVETQTFPADLSLDVRGVVENQDILDNVRLWDPPILGEAYAQLQAIKPYYEFPDVDVDRYEVDGKMRQILLSGRELSLDDIPEAAKTWSNLHLQYTHGYGLVASLANEQTSAGQPSFLVKDVPGTVTPGAEAFCPRNRASTTPRSSTTTSTRSSTSDRPRSTTRRKRASRGATTTGEGGIRIGGFLNQLAFAIREGDPNLVLSDLVQATRRSSSTATSATVLRAPLRSSRWITIRTRRRWTVASYGSSMPTRRRGGSLTASGTTSANWFRIPTRRKRRSPTSCPAITTTSETR